MGRRGVVKKSDAAGAGAGDRPPALEPGRCAWTESAHRTKPRRRPWGEINIALQSESKRHRFAARTRTHFVGHGSVSR